MKANVDRNTCIGCGLCEALCPRGFKMDDEGLAVGLPGDLDGEDLAQARDAESQCPVAAITVE